MADKEDEEYVELTASGKAVDQPSTMASTTPAAGDLSKTVGESWREKYMQWRHQSYKLPRHYRLSTEENASKYSLWRYVRFSCQLHP